MENQINIGNKNTRMFSILILGVLVIGILGWYIFSVVYKINQLGSNSTPTQPRVFIQFPKTTYGYGESIIFTITNNTQQNVYYFPETCASSLVQVFLILDNDSTLIQGDQKICMLAPSVETLLPNGSITSKIPEKTFSKMAPGTYKMKFEYSIEKRDRFVIGEHSAIDSETFTIVK